MNKFGTGFPPDRYLCPKGLIEANPAVKSVVNPATDEFKILKEYKEFLEYCKNCLKQELCTERHKDKIKGVFDSFSPPSEN